MSNMNGMELFEGMVKMSCWENGKRVVRLVLPETGYGSHIDEKGEIAKHRLDPVWMMATKHGDAFECKGGFVVFEANGSVTFNETDGYTIEDPKEFYKGFIEYIDYAKEVNADQLREMISLLNKN